MSYEADLRATPSKPASASPDPVRPSLNPSDPGRSEASSAQVGPDRSRSVQSGGRSGSSESRRYLDGFASAARVIAAQGNDAEASKGGIGVAIGIRHRYREPLGTYAYPVSAMDDGEADAYLVAYGLDEVRQ